MHFHSFSLTSYTFIFSVIVQYVVGDIFEQLQDIPRGWTLEREASPSEPISLRISLQNQNIESFYQKVLEISTPSHENYGKHMEQHEIRNMLRPRDDSSDEIQDWLESRNIMNSKDGGHWISFQTTVENANRLLDTKFAWYRSEDGEEILRTMGYSLPGFVASHVNFIQPTTRFGSMTKMRSGISMTGSKSIHFDLSNSMDVQDHVRSL